MGIHVVEAGESLSSIAKRFKVATWQDIYNHPQNENFRKLRKNPNVIHVGDKVFVPVSNGAPAKAPPPPAAGSKDAIVELQIKGKTYVGTKQELEKVVDAVIKNLSDKPFKLAKLKLEGARTQYKVYDDLLKSDKLASWILDFVNPFQDLNPSKQALDEAEDAFKKVEAAFKGRFIVKIESELRRLETKANIAITTYRKAVEGLGGTAENMVTTLEITKLVSFAVAGACATALTGGATSGILASSGAKLGFPALISVIEATADEGGKALAGDKKQTAVTVVGNIFTAGATSVLTGKLFASPKVSAAIKKLAGNMTAVGSKLTPDRLKVIVKHKTMRDILAEYLEGTGSGALQSALKNTAQAKLHTMTGDDLVNEISSNQQGVAAGISAKAFVEWGLKKDYFLKK